MVVCERTIGGEGNFGMFECICISLKMPKKFGNCLLTTKRWTTFKRISWNAITVVTACWKLHTQILECSPFTSYALIASAIGSLFGSGLNQSCPFNLLITITIVVTPFCRPIINIRWTLHGNSDDMCHNEIVVSTFTSIFDYMR